MTTPGASERGFVNEILRAADRRAEEIVRAHLPAIRYGIVDAIDAANRKATVQLPGSGSSSPGFVYGEHAPVVGDLVRVILLPTGDRYVDAVISTSRRLRMVAVNEISIYSAATSTSNLDLAPEVIDAQVPTSGVRGFWGLLLQHCTTTGAWLSARNLSGATPAETAAVYSQVANQLQGNGFVVESGGTNNRQFRVRVRPNGGTITYYVRVGGYFWEPD